MSLPQGRRRLCRIAPFIPLLMVCLADGRSATGTGASPADPKIAQRLDPVPQAPPHSSLEDGESPLLIDGRELVLRVQAGPGDTYATLGRRYLISLGELATVRALNGDNLPQSRIVRIPYASLNDEYQGRTMQSLFPRDRPQAGEWVHIFGAGALPAGEESLWLLALWYTGSGENFPDLADRNALPDLSPRSGQEIIIPGRLLLPPFARQAGVEPTRRARRAAASATPAPVQPDRDDDFTEASDDAVALPPAPPPRGPRAVSPQAGGSGEITYGSDARGRYAIYRLKRGEALYSSVVVRFTGRVDAQDVNEVAAQIASRSGIRDVTDIPVGYRIRIPLDDLLPEFLPLDDPRRLAWEQGNADVARYTNRARSRNLQGVAVILDAGHGGRDRGTAHNGIWEHDYVYDILCRIKAILEKETGARVLPTIKDRKEGYRVQDSRRLSRSQAEILLTHPPFALQERLPGVNLRWYLSNAYFRKLVAEGYDPQKIVFTSLHADARHPSVGGAMIYVPGEEYRRGRYGHNEAVYARHREVREQPYVSFTRAERERAEGLSRQFAAALVGAFERHKVSVHPYGPVRERIIRGGRSWVPAVLRCNVVSVQALIEVSNLSNRADSRLLADPAYRQRVARAYVEALNAYYGESPDDGSRAARKR